MQICHRSWILVGLGICFGFDGCAPQTANPTGAADSDTDSHAGEGCPSTSDCQDTQGAEACPSGVQNDCNLVDVGAGTDPGPDELHVAEVCRALCDQGQFCPHPFLSGDCLGSCSAEAQDCSQTELDSLNECAANCGMLEPCITDVACVGQLNDLVASPGPACQADEDCSFGECQLVEYRGQSLRMCVMPCGAGNTDCGLAAVCYIPGDVSGQCLSVCDGVECADGFSCEGLGYADAFACVPSPDCPQLSGQYAVSSASGCGQLTAGGWVEVSQWGCQLTFPGPDIEGAGEAAIGADGSWSASAIVVGGDMTQCSATVTEATEFVSTIHLSCNDGATQCTAELLQGGWGSP